MEIKTYEQLSDLIQLCRKKGIEKLKIGEIEVTLSKDPPPIIRRKSRIAPVGSESTTHITRPYTLDELIDWNNYKEVDDAQGY